MTEKGGRLPVLAPGATIIRVSTESLGGSSRTHLPFFTKGEPREGDVRLQANKIYSMCAHQGGDLYDLSCNNDRSGFPCI